MQRPSWFEPVDSLGEWIGLVGAAVLACAIASLIAWNAVRVAKGDVTISELTCLDPTDACNWSAYRVRNDTGVPVVLRECMHHCGSGDRRLDPIDIAPGHMSPNDVRHVSALVGDRAWWEVRTQSGRLLGCLVLDGHRHKRDGDRVVVSAAAPCHADAPTTPVLNSG